MSSPPAVYMSCCLLSPPIAPQSSVSPNEGKSGGNTSGGPVGSGTGGGGGGGGGDGSGGQLNPTPMGIPQRPSSVARGASRHLSRMQHGPPTPRMHNHALFPTTSPPLHPLSPESIPCRCLQKPLCRCARPTKRMHGGCTHTTNAWGKAAGVVLAVPVRRPRRVRLRCGGRRVQHEGLPAVCQ